MKTFFKISSSLVLTLLLFTFSCSSDDDSGGSSGINVQNLVTNFDENPAIGAIVGTIQAASGNNLSFSITSQTPSGALTINPSTGELTVANASIFDFETNPVISAEISIIDPSNTANATATINLNNLDDIAFFLTTSESAYTAAADGDWVIVTETEYNALAANLNDVSKVATSDSEYDFADTINPSNPNFTIANDNGHDIADASYVFAFKYNAQTDATTNNKVLLSENTISGTFSQLGSVLPTSTTGDQFYVLKGNNNPTSSIGYLGFFNSNQMGYKNVTGAGNYSFEFGETTNPSSYFSDSVTVLYQGLSTTQKQW